MDIELEKKIEQLEQQRDNAMRIRCPLVVSGKEIPAHD